MKILGEELGKIGRWYLALPPVLLIGFLIGLFFLATAGQTRLNMTNERAHRSQMREQALNEFAGLITDAVSAQRGYLVTAESAYLAPYADAVRRVGQALDRLHEAYGGADGGSELHELRVLTGKELGELEDGVAILKRRGISPAASAVGTDVGKRTMDSIGAIVAKMRGEQASEAAAANAEWQRDFRLSSWVSAAGAILNIGLVLLAIRLVYSDLRRRARHAAALHDQKSQLELEVEARTSELTALSTHLQGVSEQEKSALSRELHDELGRTSGRGPHGSLLAAAALADRGPVDRAALQAHSRIFERRRRFETPRGRGAAPHAARQHGVVHGIALAIQGDLPPHRLAMHRNYS